MLDFFLKDKESVDLITRALILSLSVCYHARLQERAEFEEGVVAQFMAPIDCDSVVRFHDEIKWLVKFSFVLFVIFMLNFWYFDLGHKKFSWIT